MKSSLLVAALGLVAVSNAWVLAHVARNRSGPPDSEMALTTRELYYTGPRDEDSTATLRLQWRNSAPEYRTGKILDSDSPGWFDPNKLEELGFDVSVPAVSKSAQRHYEKARAREVFVALEFDGPAYQQWLMQNDFSYYTQIPPAERLSIEQQTGTRLVAIDAGLDAAALRRKYPDGARVTILAGLARVVREPKFLRGAITRIATELINVPAGLNRQVDPRIANPSWTYTDQKLKIEPPRYELTLRTGSLHEPWIVRVRPLPIP